MSFKITSLLRVATFKEVKVPKKCQKQQKCQKAKMSIRQVLYYEKSIKNPICGPIQSPPQQVLTQWLSRTTKIHPYNKNFADFSSGVVRNIDFGSLESQKKILMSSPAPYLNTQHQPIKGWIQECAECAFAQCLHQIG